MSMLKKITTWFAALFAATVLMTAYAADPVIEQAKAQGIVGEQFDGYLGIIDGSKASADLKRRVSENNAGRLQVYSDISKKTGDSVQVVAAAMAEKNIARAGSGEIVKPGSNDPWTKKP